MKHQGKQKNSKEQHPRFFKLTEARANLLIGSVRTYRDEHLTGDVIGMGGGMEYMKQFPIFFSLSIHQQYELLVGLLKGLSRFSCAIPFENVSNVATYLAIFEIVEDRLEEELCNQSQGGIYEVPIIESEVFKCPEGILLREIDENAESVIKLLQKYACKRKRGLKKEKIGEKTSKIFHFLLKQLEFQFSSPVLKSYNEPEDIFGQRMKICAVLSEFGIMQKSRVHVNSTRTFWVILLRIFRKLFFDWGDGEMVKICCMRKLDEFGMKWVMQSMRRYAREYKIINVVHAENTLFILSKTLFNRRYWQGILNPEKDPTNESVKYHREMAAHRGKDYVQYMEKRAKFWLRFYDYVGLYFNVELALKAYQRLVSEVPEEKIPVPPCFGMHPTLLAGPTSFYLKCARCGEKEEEGKKRFQRCSACRIERYCGKQCQKKHWKDHKVKCKKWKGKRYR